MPCDCTVIIMGVAMGVFSGIVLWMIYEIGKFNGYNNGYCDGIEEDHKIRKSRVF